MGRGLIPTPGASFTAMPLGKGLTVHYLALLMGFEIGGSVSVHTELYNPIKSHLQDSVKV